MPQAARTLTHQQARAFYDWMGTKQDLQAFYEGLATRDLIAHADFAEVHAVFECGCGTGAFAQQVLISHLPSDARYVAMDSSTTMVRIAKARLARFGSRVDVRQTHGSLQFEAASNSFDRFVSNYVIDLLSIADIEQLLAEAHRILMPQGYLCLVSLTYGSTWSSRFVMGLWTRIHALRPALLGGCRPLALRELLSGTHWQVRYAHVITAFGIPSEVVVASRLDV